MGRTRGPPLYYRSSAPDANRRRYYIRGFFHRGFFYGWVIVAVGTIAMGVGGFMATSPFSAFLTPMSQDLGWSRTVLNGAQSVGTILGGLSAPLAGRLIDRYGGRVVLTLSGLTIALALTLCATVQEPWQFFVAYGLGRITFQGVVQLAVPTVVAQWFVRRRGRATGLALMGNAAAVALAVPLILWIVEQAGWRAAWLTLAVLALVLLTPAAALLLRRRPEDLGLLPDGDTPRAPPAAPTDKEPPAPATEVSWPVRAALHTPTFWLLLLTGGLNSMSTAGVTTYQIPLLLHNGVPSATVAAMVSVYAVVWAVGGVLWGFAADRLAPRLMLATVYVVEALGTLILLGADNPAPALAFALLYGLMQGGSLTLESVIWASYYGRGSLGSIRGFGRPFVMVANAAGPLAAAVLVDRLDSYEVPFFAFAAITLFAGLLVLLARPPRRHRPTTT